ncbi:MAG: DUF1028 domain-containing protein [Candidatus Methylopumilus sp.]|nr:DUF1028 domain-containing protein [Candidatus Methylopumilus sp.]
MTWSILARDESGYFGMAIASRFFAVGSLCVHSRRGVGALSSQALLNPLYGPAGLDLLAQHCSPEQTIERLIQHDQGRDQRQLHILPFKGLPAAHTGSACVDWCGHLLEDGLSVAGNMLAGPKVIEHTAQAFKDTRGKPMGERLLAALDAGQAAGGDKRGKQAAALKIHNDEDYLQLDLRVDDHEEPFVELRRLYNKSLERFQPFLECLPSRHRPSGITERREIDAHIEQYLARIKGA